MPKVAGDLSSINAISFNNKRYPFLLGLETTFVICSMHWSVILFDALVRCMSIVCRSSRPEAEVGGVLPYMRLMVMCRWMLSHFHDWIDYNGCIFNRVTRMGSHIFGFWGEENSLIK